MSFPRKSIVLAILLVSLDQLTKYAVSYAFVPGASLEILPFFHLTYGMNTGIAFSFFQNSNTFFLIFTLVAMLLIGFWYAKNFEKLPKLINLCVILIFSGAMGNFIDRFFRGHVVDFLDFNIGSYHWPAFNVADSCVTIGGLILLLVLMKSKERIVSKEK